MGSEIGNIFINDAPQGMALQDVSKMISALTTKNARPSILGQSTFGEPTPNDGFNQDESKMLAIWHF
eukprot:5011073-Karenia_brevis.AAC.1